MTALASTFLIGSSSNKGKHKSLDEFEIMQDPTKDMSKLPSSISKNPHRLIMGEML